VIERNREGRRDRFRGCQMHLARDRYIWLEVADPAQS